MAVSISSTGYYNLTADTNLDMPSGDFAWGFRLRSTKADADNNFLIDQFDNTNLNGIRIWLNPSEALVFSLDGSSITYTEIIASTGVVTDGKNHIVVGQRSGTNLQIKSAEFGDTSVTSSSVAVSTAGQVVADDMHLFADQDLNSSQYATSESMGEFFKLNRALSNEEILALANGVSPLMLLGNDLLLYIPAHEHDSGGLHDLIGGLTATVQSSSHSTEEHFPIVSGMISMVTVAAAVATTKRYTLTTLGVG